MKKDLQIKCYMCKSLITQPGALLFSPPELLEDNGVLIDYCQKFHACIDCFQSIINFINSQRAVKIKKLRNK